MYTVKKDEGASRLNDNPHNNCHISGTPSPSPDMAHTYAHDFDSSVHRAGYIPGTEYTLPYLSRFSIAHDDEADLLRHVNCSFLSAPGVPPTLLALKQHAQSLAYLIAMLQPHGGDNDAVEVLVKRAEAKKANKRRKTGTTSSGNGVTDGSLLRELVSSTDDTTTDNPFDWLDLSRAYTNDTDPGHHRPLMDLVNEVQSRHDALDETTYHCPLTTYKPRNGGRYARGPNADAKVNTDGGDEREWDEENFDKVRPYASYHGLLLHANMCLERLDHEYAATGGLLSLLPVRRVDNKDDTDEEPEMVAARNTLVGQWLAFTQSLVGRTTELEVAYANAAHALRGQATADSAGADTAKWRMIHAGADIWQDVHNKLDTAGTADYKWAEHRNTQGVVGEQAVGNGYPQTQNQTEFVNYVDINTRYYRTDIYGAPPVHGPIYVCPVGAPKDLSSVVDPNGRGSAAAASDADMSATANVDNMRILTASALEQRYDRRLQEAGRIARANKRLAEQALQQTQALLVLRQDHKQCKHCTPSCSGRRTRSGGACKRPKRSSKGSS